MTEQVALLEDTGTQKPDRVETQRRGAWSAMERMIAIAGWASWFPWGRDVSSAAATPAGDLAAHLAAMRALLRTRHTYLDPLSLLVMATARAALTRANIPVPLAEPDQACIHLATATGCSTTLDTCAGRLRQDGAHAVPPFLFTHAFMNTPAGLLAMELDCRGGGNTVCAGSMGGIMALEEAGAELARGPARIAVVVAADWPRPGSADSFGAAAFVLRNHDGEGAQVEIPCPGSALPEPYGAWKSLAPMLDSCVGG